MKPEEYVENVLKTENIDLEAIRNRLDDRSIRLLHASMGLVTEAGEFLDALKKWLIYGKPLDETNLIEELGDSNWYQGLAIDVLETKFETIWERNIAKLKARYGDKFNEEGAINRDLDNERNILTDSSYRIVHMSIRGISTVCGLETKGVLDYTGQLQNVTCSLCIKGSKVNYSKDICGNE